MLKKIKVGKKFIGPGEPTYIIAEIGINHEGDPDVCQKMIKEAAAAGADAIKLQTYTPETITMKSTRKEFFIRDKKNIWKTSYSFLFEEI